MSRVKFLSAITRVFIVFAAAMTTACVMAPLEPCIVETVVVPVKIDWSLSNIDIDPADPSGSGYVHRVSLRFYPADGSEVFERYLESNVFEGLIEVPVGRYNVIAMNESVHDTNYWSDHITFLNAEDFDNFSATVNPMSQAEVESGFPFYDPSENENIVVAPLRLASWSMENFEVASPGVASLDGTEEAFEQALAANDALTKIVMRGLTYDVKVTAHVKNLISVQQMPAAVKGFSDMVYLASQKTVKIPSTYLTLLGSRTFNNDTDGTISRSFLSFGRMPQESAGTYTVELDILFVNGEFYTSGGAMLFDVTSQVTSSDGFDITIDLPDNEGGQIELPYIEGGIVVDEWDDDEITLN